MFQVLLLPEFALQAALRHQPGHRGAPAAVLTDGVSAKAAIFQVNAAARAAGVEAGMTSSQALAHCRSVRILARLPAQEASAATALLETAFSCSPWVEATADGICTVEVRGERQHNHQREGRRVIDHLAQLDLHAKVGLAATPDLALLAAHAAAPCLIVTDAQDFLRGLPLNVLAPSPAVAAILKKWGIHTLGALSALPPQAVTRRLGSEGHALWERAAGRGRRLLQLAAAPVVYEEGIDFEYEIETLEPLLFIIRRFLGQLVARLECVYRVPATLHLRLRFDDGREYCREFRIPAPTGNVETLFRVVHTHLENFTASTPIRSLHLSATPTVTSSEQFGLFETALRDPNRFSETLARLHALLGADRAGIACLENTHRPDAFHVDPPDFLHLKDSPTTGKAVARQPPAYGLPLRRWRPPLALRVEMNRRVPVRVVSGVVHGQVRSTRGPYQLHGGWWDRQPWTCEEWDIELAQGGIYRLSRQGDDWFLEGTYG